MSQKRRDPYKYNFIIKHIVTDTLSYQLVNKLAYDLLL